MVTICGYAQLKISRCCFHRSLQNWIPSTCIGTFVYTHFVGKNLSLSKKSAYRCLTCWEKLRPSGKVSIVDTYLLRGTKSLSKNEYLLLCSSNDSFKKTESLSTVKVCLNTCILRPTWPSPQVSTNRQHTNNNHNKHNHLSRTFLAPAKPVTSHVFSKL